MRNRASAWDDAAAIRRFLFLKISTGTYDVVIHAPGAVLYVLKSDGRGSGRAAAALAAYRHSASSSGVTKRRAWLER